MSSFSSSNEPYAAIMRKLRNNEPLTPEQARYVLENPYPTGYSCAKSASHLNNNPREHINPNLNRSSLLSSDTSTSSSCDTSRLQLSSSKNKDKRIALSKIRGWIWIFAMIGLLLIGWRIYLKQCQLASTQTCPNVAARDVFCPPEKAQCLLVKDVKESDPPPPSTNEQSASSKLPLSADDPYEAKIAKLKKEMDKIQKEIYSTIEILHKSNDGRIAAAVETHMKRLEHAVNDLFEKERQQIRAEQEQHRRDIEESVYQQQTAEDEIAKLVQNAINKMVDKIVREQIDARVSDNSMEVIEEKIATTFFDALQKYDYDRTGEADFALESAGGEVLSIRGTKEYDSYHSRETLHGVTLLYNSVKPRILIHRSSQNINAGECWAIEGEKANLVIKLARKISVTAITYEHLPRELSFSENMNSAPKMFNIYSLQYENDSDKLLIGKYIFDIEKEPLQRFAAEKFDSRGTPIIEFELLSNYGSEFTCLYRLRVHGNHF
uniref:SUN domain-containing protein n=1 Tax=Panagrolaimus sp. PS1159 TaxID=55785 RepID=A0AC35FZ41_9BILA